MELNPSRMLLNLQVQVAVVKHNHYLGNESHVDNLTHSENMPKHDHKHMHVEISQIMTLEKIDIFIVML